MSLQHWLRTLIPSLRHGRASTAADAVRHFRPGLDPAEPASLPRVDCIDPALLHLVRGQDYLWCSCGRSRRQPLCDGSHAGSGLKPLRFTPAKSQTFWLCNCKYTRTPPYCDAAHNRLPELHARRVTTDAN